MRGATLRPGTALNLGLVGGFAALCLGGLLFLALNIGLRYPGEAGYQVNALFSEANGVVPQDEVRIAGVKVGSVTAVGPAADGSTRVTMELNGGYRLRRDARVVVRPKSLLGTKYIEVVRTPRSASPYLPSGATLDKSQTGEAVEIDDVLNNLDPQTRRAMSESFRQLGVALDGRAEDVNQALPAVDQLAANLRPLAQVGDRRQAELARIMVDLDTIMQALADEQDSLGRIVDSGNRVFGGVAARDQELGGAIQNANGFLGGLDAAFSTAGVTAADRRSLAAAPDQISVSQHTLSLTNGGIDQLLPEILIGQINYPADQLTVMQADSITLTREWISAFFQHDFNGNSFRITNINPSAPAAPAPDVPKLGADGKPLPALPPVPSLPGAPLPTSTPTPDPITCGLVGVICKP